MSNFTLNCQGMPCPEPVVLCRNTINEKAPESLEVIVDNAAALENVSRFLTRQGYTVQSEAQGELWRINGVLHGPLAAQNEATSAKNVATPEQIAERKTVVLLTSALLGQGDDLLGTKLMENFLATLPELGEELWQVILLNSAVQLTAVPGKNVDSLQRLEELGVTVLVCGACLDFYKLLEAKKVGQTTNMLDVVTALGLADKVIHP